jgi:hypothetical protein
MNRACRSVLCVPALAAFASLFTACEDIEPEVGDGGAADGGAHDGGAAQDGAAATGDGATPIASALVATPEETPALAAYLDLPAQRLYVVDPAFLATAIETHRWNLEWSPGATLAFVMNAAGVRIPLCVVPVDSSDGGGLDAGPTGDGGPAANDGGGEAGAPEAGASEGGLSGGAECEIVVRFSPQGVAGMRPTVGSTRLLKTFRKKLDHPAVAGACFPAISTTDPLQKSAKFTARPFTSLVGDGTELGTETALPITRQYNYGVADCAAELIGFEEISTTWVLTVGPWPNP